MWHFWGYSVLKHNHRNLLRTEIKINHTVESTWWCSFKRIAVTSRSGTMLSFINKGYFKHYKSWAASDRWFPSIPTVCATNIQLHKSLQIQFWVVFCEVCSWNCIENINTWNLINIEILYRQYNNCFIMFQDLENV